MANGDPGTAASAPVLEFSENADTVFVPWFATNTNRASGVARIPWGLLPPVLVAPSCVPAALPFGCSIMPSISPLELPSKVTPIHEGRLFPKGTIVRSCGAAGSAMVGPCVIAPVLPLTPTANISAEFALGSGIT